MVVVKPLHLLAKFIIESCSQDIETFEIAWGPVCKAVSYFLERAFQQRGRHKQGNGIGSKELDHSAVVYGQFVLLWDKACPRD